MYNYKGLFHRRNFLDHCFRNRAYNFEDLLDAINEYLETIDSSLCISTRSLRADINLFKDSIKGFGAPLSFQQNNYQYTDSEFSIAQQPLLRDEQEILEIAIILLERFENHPKYNRLAEAIIQFQDNDYQKIEENSQVLYYDNNDEYKGIDKLKPLYLAVLKNQVLNLTYKNFSDKNPESYIFHPQLLKQYNRRWFVFGINETVNNEIWSFPLDERLISFVPLEDKKYMKTEVDWESYFRNLVGVTRTKSSKVEEVILQFYNGREHYFNSKPFILDSDESTLESEKGRVWFEAVINNELVQQILSYGKDVEVIAPIELKNRLKDQVQEMMRYYKH